MEVYVGPESGFLSGLPAVLSGLSNVWDGTLSFMEVYVGPESGFRIKFESNGVGAVILGFES